MHQAARQSESSLLGFAVALQLSDAWLAWQTGLTQACLDATHSMEQVDALVAAYVAKHFPTNGAPRLSRSFSSFPDTFSDIRSTRAPGGQLGARRPRVHQQGPAAARE